MTIPETPREPRECILVVDDQAANIQTVGTLLNSVGYDVMSATSADQALQRMRARKPDLLLLDMMMPGTNGLELCRVLAAKQALEEMPVIFLSAADEVNVITAALEAGAVDYVTKPFHRAELLSRIRTHLALKSARHQMRKAAEDKDELLGLMAHDLQNCLVAVRMHADFLADGTTVADPAAAQCVASISREAERMAECIRDLLANQGAGQHPLRREAVPVAGMLREVVASQTPAAVAKRQSLMLEPQEDESLVVVADPAALRQVLVNLLSNAVKFSPPGSVTRIRADRSPASAEAVTISVSDEGPGFTEEDRPHIFKRYGRLSARPTGGETSTGLGLSIVKKLTELMGGTVSLQTTAGRGSTFSLRLPAG